MDSIAKIAKMPPRRAKANPHLHSPAHLLADELSLKLNDRKHFALYLGLAKKINHQYLRKILGDVLEADNVKNPGRLFAFLVKKHREEIK